MNELEIRYDELEESISILNIAINGVTNKYVKGILEDCKERLEEEFNEIKDRVESIWESEKKELENEYWRSVVQ